MKKGKVKVHFIFQFVQVLFLIHGVVFLSIFIMKFIKMNSSNFGSYVADKHKTNLFWKFKIGQKDTKKKGKYGIA